MLLFIHFCYGSNCARVCVCVLASMFGPCFWCCSWCYFLCRNHLAQEVRVGCVFKYVMVVCALCLILFA